MLSILEESTSRVSVVGDGSEEEEEDDGEGVEECCSEGVQVAANPYGLGGCDDAFSLSLRHRCADFSFVFRDVAGTRFLTHLSISHLFISCLPPEIGLLKKLQKLDISSNKLEHLPDSLSELTDLKLLTAANNKLVVFPYYICNLQRLSSLDLSNNKLTSLGAVDLFSMPALQFLNIQDNKLLIYSKAPSRVCYKVKGKKRDPIKDENISQSDVEFELDIHRFNVMNSFTGSCNGKLHASQRPLKGCTHHDSLQQKARQERLNHSRSCKGSGHIELLPEQLAENFSGAKQTDYLENMGHSLVVQLGSTEDSSARVVNISKSVDSGAPADNICESRRFWNSMDYTKNRDLGDSKGDCSTSFSCISTEISEINRNSGFEDEADSINSSISCARNLNKVDDISSSQVPGIGAKSKRHYDDDLDNNPKPRKFHRPIDESLDVSFKYSSESMCSFDDWLLDGFYDAGRGRPFLPLQDYDDVRFLDREVILLDRRKDEDLDGILLSARLLFSRLKTFCDSPAKEQLVVNDFQRASILSLFVSDVFGGSDRSSSLVKMRKAASGSKEQQPFVCTCSSINKNNKEIFPGYTFFGLCENSLRQIKEFRNSNIVPIGALRLGVCRHRALLMKYLCDRMDPPIPCELVRGYLDYMPHAWNVVLVQNCRSQVRMVVDTCYPTDIREEIDPEYFCRYIPLSRCLVPSFVDSPMVGCSFPSVFLDLEKDKGLHHNVKRCRFGSLDAAMKVRNLYLNDVSLEDMKIFEYSFLGEVRILGALRNHKCIVEVYGHRLSSECVPVNGSNELRNLRSMIFMEYVKGGSLKSYLRELSRKGAKHVQIDLAMYIAKVIACALVEVHSKLVIHRDIKSENVLFDLESTRVDGSPVVKLADFDRAVPLQSSLHTCCIGHIGVHPPDFCVGTPNWMAPEVVQAISRRSPYGLEVDIWSYGCLLYELLTLKIPYDGLLDSEVYELIQMGYRPSLPPELEKLVFLDQADSGSCVTCNTYSSSEMEKLKLLIKLFYQCTLCNPADRPTARQIYVSISDVLPATEVGID